MESGETERRARRNPPWARDELILACDLVRQNDWRWLPAEDPRVIELSRLLQVMPLHPPEVRDSKFRNPNGVGRKTADIATRHPDYRGKPTNGGALDLEVLQNFLDRPDEMRATAEAIRQGVRSGAFVSLAPTPDDEDEAEAPEGRLLVRRHLARERDRKLRNEKLRRERERHGCLRCEVCGFDFEKTYGTRGSGFAECHHVVPLHVSGPAVNRLQDLAVLCANCHRMIHRGKPWLTLDELRKIVRARIE
jgi:5-methylcytosine-specific restriction protein A